MRMVRINGRRAVLPADPPNRAPPHGARRIPLSWISRIPTPKWTSRFGHSMQP